MYSDDVMTDQNVRSRNETEISGLEKLIRFAIFTACIAAGFVFVWLVGVTPFLPFSKIDISPVDGLSRETLLMNMGIRAGVSSYIFTDTEAIEKALMGMPQIASVQVYKHFPDRLEVAIEGRKAVAMSLAQYGDRTASVFFDAKGVIFRIGAGNDNELTALPLISGLVLDNPVLGMSLPPVLVPLLSELEMIKEKSPALLSAIMEIRIDQKNTNGFDLIVYPAHRQTRVRLSELNEDILRYTMLMVDALAAREPGIGFIDFRSGIASYNAADNAHGIGGLP